MSVRFKTESFIYYAYSFRRRVSRLKSKNLELQNRVTELQTDVGEKKLLIAELRKELNDLTASYRHQSCLLENIRNDKNTFSQNLTQTKVNIVAKRVLSPFLCLSESANYFVRKK